MRGGIRFAKWLPFSVSLSPDRCARRKASKAPRPCFSPYYFAGLALGPDALSGSETSSAHQAARQESSASSTPKHGRGPSPRTVGALFRCGWPTGKYSGPWPRTPSAFPFRRGWPTGSYRRLGKKVRTFYLREANICCRTRSCRQHPESAKIGPLFGRFKFRSPLQGRFPVPESPKVDPSFGRCKLHYQRLLFPFVVTSEHFRLAKFHVFVGT